MSICVFPEGTINGYPVGRILKNQKRRLERSKEEMSNLVIVKL
jgi:hypothetical protein